MRAKESGLDRDRMMLAEQPRHFEDFAFTGKVEAITGFNLYTSHALRQQCVQPVFSQHKQLFMRRRAGGGHSGFNPAATFCDLLIGRTV